MRMLAGSVAPTPLVATKASMMSRAAREADLATVGVRLGDLAREGHGALFAGQRHDVLAVDRVRPAIAKVDPEPRPEARRFVSSRPSAHGMSKNTSHRSATSPSGTAVGRTLGVGEGDGFGVGFGVGVGVGSGVGVGVATAATRLGTGDSD